MPAAVLIGGIEEIDPHFECPLYGADRFLIIHFPVGSGYIAILGTDPVQPAESIGAKAKGADRYAAAAKFTMLHDLSLLEEPRKTDIGSQ